MTQRKLHQPKSEPLPKDAQCTSGDIAPLMVASKDVGRIILGFSSKTAANLRSQKRGPRYYMDGGTPYYKVSELIDYFCRNRVETFNND
jgi:hypothetical protein